MTLVNINKNNATLTGALKNSASLSSINKNGLDSFILTDALDYILVGASENLTLIYAEGQLLTNISKNNG